jgi:uncharacterized membrane protein YgcG
MATQSRTLKLSILAETKKLSDALKGSGKDVTTFGSQISAFGKKAALAFAAAGVAFGAFAKIAVSSASDLAETISKVGVLFGSSAKEIEIFAGTAAKSLGQTKQQALDAAATFAIFGTSAGLSGQELSKFSIDFVKLASDLSSFNNTSPQDAINAIGSALRGEAEPLRRYGVLLNDASLKQAALSLGIITTTTQALTPQQKVLAAQKLIFEQTTAAQGDFARTSDGLANQTKILTAQLENMKTEIGTALLPIVLQLATAFSEKIIPNLQAFVYGLTGNNGFSDALTESQKTAFEWGERLKSVIGTVVDLKEELIVLGGILATVFVVSKISAAVAGTIALITGLIKAYNALKASAIVAGVATYFALNPAAGVAAAAIAAGVLAAAQNLISRSDIDVGDFNVAGVTGNGSNFNFGAGNPLFQSSGGGGGGGGGGGAGGGFAGGGGGGGAGGGGGGGIGGVIQGAVNLPDLVQKLQGVSDKIADTTFLLATDAISSKTAQRELNALQKEFRVLERQGLAVQSMEAASSFNPLSGIRTPFNEPGATNITVNMGVVGDPEGAKRAIIDLQNEGFYRGTGGANLLQGFR